MPEVYAAPPDFAFPRNFKGYGEKGLEGLKWPNNAKIAVSFVINYEEGGERSVMKGDGVSEISLREYPAQHKINERDYSGESEFEYGSRRGWWRLFKLFNDYKMKFTLYAVGSAVEEQPEVVSRCVEEGHDVASHAYRWIDHGNLGVEAEKQHIRDGITALKKLTGYAPKGWYYGRPSPQSRALIPLVYEEMGEELLWASDTYADDVPYWTDLPQERSSENPKGCLMVPYSYDCNDFKFHTQGTGFRSPGGFYEHIKNAFDVLYEEGEDGSPKMMTIGLHCRIIGRPGRFKALQDFVKYISSKEGVWVATRTEIAEAFREQFPYKKGQLA
ncbi:chitin deacetylase 1 [Boeremia exigua]|uniref:chitin deacetylase 1 n=1 Tax=Boeremia exigua TaxID=749465 RepID=UPI001E8E4B56|nr:chitin deacetylase 1 [Boeremia exigua]KAH6621775.1 chitin deacetylase 1 [Boeremia exigua]